MSGFNPVSNATSNLPQSHVTHYDRVFVENLKAQTPAAIQPRINKETCWLQKRLQIGPDEFRIGLHLTKDATQRPGQFLLVRKVSIVSSCLARVSPQSLRWIQLR